MNKIKITGLVLTLLLSFNGLAQQNRQDRSDSEIVMTKAELESFLQLVAKKKRESLKKEKLNALLQSSNKKGATIKGHQVYERSDIDRINDRIDMLMQTLYFGNALQGRDNSTIITSSPAGANPNDRIAYLQNQIDSLKASYAEQGKVEDAMDVVDGKEVKPSYNEERLSPERRSYLEDLLAKYRGFKKQVFFANDSDKVSEDDIEYIKDVANVLKQNPELSVLLKGYASPKGNANYNKALSMRRSENVLEELRKRGIPDDRLEASFYGEDHSTSEAGARRVDMSVVIK